MRILLVTTMRNEGPFILEWIAYHQHIGVTDFLVYSNDCDDGTDALLDRLAALGIVTHERNHSGGKKSVQWRALNKADRHPLLQSADWIFGADVDEFLNIHVGDGKIADLIGTVPDVAGFAIPWRLFGNAGVVRFKDVAITEQFTKAAPEALVWPWRAVLYKSLYRKDARYQKMGVHRPKLVGGAAAGLWVDGNGAPLQKHPGVFQRTTQPRYGLAQINHYALGSMEGFLVKAARGKPNHSHDPIDLAYWIDRNLNEVTDISILRHQHAVQARVAAFMADEKTAALHRASVVWRQAKVASLLETLEGYNMLARLQHLPPTRVLPMVQQTKLLTQLSKVRALTDARED